MEGQQRFVIFSGANERAIIACCRHFTLNAIPFSIISRAVGDKIFLTTYNKNIDARRAVDHLDADDMLMQLDVLREKYPADKLIYLPTAESVNRVVLKYRNRFTCSGLTVTLCEENTYITLSDKAKFNALAQSFGILLPQHIESLSLYSLPFVAKPSQEYSKANGQKIYPQLVFTEEQYSVFSQQYDVKDFFFQKYIDGCSYYLLLFLSGSNVKKIWQKNIMQQADGKSIIAAEVCSCPDVRFESTMINLLQSINYAGFIMVEIMRENNNSYLIEANPRLWGPFGLAINHGFNPEWVALTGHYPDVKCKQSPYLWINGWLSNLGAGKKIRQFIPNKQSMLWYLLRGLAGEIYFRQDTYRLFLYESKSALSTLLKRKFSIERSENAATRID